MTELTGKRAIITAGANVAVCDIDQAAVDDFNHQFPQARAVICDVANSAAVDAVFAEMSEALGGVDILVNNAGSAGPTAGIEDIDPENWQRTLDINLFSQFLFTRAVVPGMKAQRSGVIVNMSSAAGRLGMPMRTPYVAAKWATIGFDAIACDGVGCVQHSRERNPAGISAGRSHGPCHEGPR